MFTLKTVHSENPAIPQVEPPIHKAKRLIESTFPKSCEAIREWWYERVSYEMLKTISARHGLAVEKGPFRNLKYPAELLAPGKVTKYALLPKIIGCYEAELAGILARVAAGNYERVVNIGCSEGYYAIGLARSLPNARVFAFDIDPLARNLCAKMANVNDVSGRVEILGECTLRHLQQLVRPNTLMVSDCEGCELQLLRPDLAPGLRACDLVVELHDCFDPTTSKVVTGRFAQSHDTVMLEKVIRDPSEYPLLEGFTPYQKRLAVSESRWGIPCKWAFMTCDKM
jgi:hypothetical protein